jgi:NADPH2:quinone reductase
MLMASLFGWLAQGRIKPQLTHTYPLAETPKALEALLARRAIGKLVIRP